eukprot:IDg11123t1
MILDVLSANRGDAKKNEADQLPQEMSIPTQIDIQEMCGQIQRGVNVHRGKIGAKEVPFKAESSAMDETALGRYTQIIAAAEGCRELLAEKRVDCIVRERTDLVGRECTRRQAYSADTVGRCAIEGSMTMLEVAYAVASARPARSMKANIGRLEHWNATSRLLDLPEQDDVPVES